jgi:hypothetical protein
VTLFALNVLALVSCTLLGSRELVQCRQNSDCATSPLSNAICSNGLCAAPTTTNLTDASPGDAGTDAQPACVSSTDCHDAPSRCIEGRCLKLIEAFNDPVAAGCFDIVPNVREVYTVDDPILIGAYVNVGDQVTDQPSVRLLTHAIDEINTKSAQTQRPLVAIVCRKERSKPKDVINYLASRKVPLVVGQFEAVEIQDIASLAKDKNIAVWSTLGNTRSLQAIDTGGYVRFFLDDIEATGAGFQAALDLATARVMARPSPPSTIKLAIVVGTDAESKALATEITETNKLTLNGVPLGSGNGKFINVPLPAQPSAVASGHPDVVIALAGDEIFATGGTTPTFVRNVETLYATNQHPIWIFGPRTRPNMQILTQIFQTNGRARVLGVDFSGDRVRHATFLKELTKAKSDPLQYAAGSFDALYDALYVAAYAGLFRPNGAAPPQPLSATDFNQHLSAFFPADLYGASTPVVEVGVASQVFETGVNRMTAGDRVRLQGATGALEWDRAGDQIANTRKMGTSMYCMRPSNAGQPPLLFYADPDTVADAGAGCAQE